MAQTFREYNAPATYSFTFPSYQSSDVKVRVDGVLKTAGTHYNITGYTTTGGGTVTFIDNSGSGGTNHVPSSGVVRIYRDTSVDVAKATYTAGSSVKAADLNNNNTQLLYRAQEEQVPNLIQSYDIAASAIETSNIKDANVTGAKIATNTITQGNIATDGVSTDEIAANAITNTELANLAVQTENIAADGVRTTNIQNGAVTHPKLANDAVDGDNIADDSINSEHYVDGSIDTAHIADSQITTAKIAGDAVTGAKIADDQINSEHYVDGSIDEQHIANSAVTSNKIADGTVGTLELANGAVTTAKLAADAVTTAKIANTNVTTDKIANNAVTAAKIANSTITQVQMGTNSVSTDEIAANAITATEIATGAVSTDELADNAITTAKIASNAVTDSEIATGTLDNRYFTETELTNGALDGRYFTETESDARYFNISSGETIKDGDTFPDNDTTIATTAAINDRIIDIVNDVGGFDIVESEQHFPNTNPQGQAGSAAVLSIKAASTNLVPSGTTVTIVNGNLANNANITITGVTSTIPSGFGFIVESTNTLHTYTFHRLVPKATEVTTVASNITNINNAANNETNINAAVSNASNINAAVSNASNINAAVSNASNINAAVSNASNINAAVSNASNITTTASNITNVNNVGNNVTNVNSVSNSAGANQTFTVTVQNVSGNKYFIDGVQTPVLKLARGKTYTFDQSDSSNSGHQLAFKDSSDNYYNTGITTNGTAGSSGASVVIAVAANAPSSLKYYCTSHGNAMGNTITVIDDNVGIVAGSIANVNTTAGSIANVNTTAGSISNVNTVASNISNVNSFFNVYRIGSSNPTSSLDVGDLFFNTATNSLKVYTGSAWVDGVTQTGNFALKTGNTFTGSNIYNDNVKALFGTGSDLEIYHTGSVSYIKNSTGDLRIDQAAASSQASINSNIFKLRNTAVTENYLQAFNNGAVELYYDNSKRFETESTGAKVTGQLNVTSHINLPNVNTFLKGGGHDVIQVDATRSYFYGGSNGVQIRKADNSAYIVTVDDNGNTTIAGDLELTGDKTLKIGVSDDLQLFHTSGNSRIQNATGALSLQSNDLKLGNYDLTDTYFRGQTNNAAELYFDNSKKFETNAQGIVVSGDINLTFANGYSLFADQSGNLLRLGDNIKLQLGNAGDLQIYHDGSNSYLVNTTGELNIRDESRIKLRTDQFVLNNNANDESIIYAAADGAVELYHDNTKRFETTSSGADVTGRLMTDGVFIGDGGNNDTSLSIGANNDLRLYHDGSNSYIRDRGTGSLSISGSQVSLDSSDLSEYMIKAVENAQVELYYNGSKKFETQSTGAKVTGVLTTSSNIRVSGEIDLGTTNGNKFMDVCLGDNYAFYLRSTSGEGANHENLMVINRNQGAKLYYDAVQKFQTTSAGIEISGSGTNAVEINGNGGRELYSYHDSAGVGWATNSGGSYGVLLYLDANGDTARLYTGNTERFRAHSNGINVSGNIAVTGTVDGVDIAALNTTVGNITTDVVSDTSPQLGGDLDFNGHNAVLQGAGGNSSTSWTSDSWEKIFFDAGYGVDATSGPNKIVIHNDSTWKAGFGVSNNQVNCYAGNGSFVVYGAANNDSMSNIEEMARFTTNGAASLRYDNQQKLATTSGGIAITGQAIATGNSAKFQAVESGGATVEIRCGGSEGYVGTQTNHKVSFITNGTRRWELSGAGSLIPYANNSYDIGSTSYRVRNIYTNDLHLSNEGSSNDVDGSWGDWTIQEGESDLFLKNNRSGKKYKFNLMEVA